MPVKNFPVLYHKGKGGKLYSWEVSAEGDTITSVAGTLDGAKTTTSKRVEQKNVGKANETSLEDQAIKEAQAMWIYKLERKYSETQEDAQETLELPMLAHEFEKKKKKIVYPVQVQPKLDGCRALAKWDGKEVVLTSRNGKVWEFVPHINRALEKMLPKDEMLDGELYIHGKNFQEITRLIKKTRPDTVTVEYHVYDSPSNKTWSDRFLDLYSIPYGNDESNKIILVPTTTCLSEEEVIKTHDEYVAEGYEGAIVRSEGPYLFGYRSNDLLKVKKFDDGEFKVVGHKSGRGRYENAVCWTCVSEYDKEFDVNPKMTIAEKEEYLKNASSYYGQPLKVRFFGRSEDGTPRFPVGIGFRLEQDM